LCQYYVCIRLKQGKEKIVHEMPTHWTRTKRQEETEDAVGGGGGGIHKGRGEESVKEGIATLDSYEVRETADLWKWEKPEKEKVTVELRVTKFL
jgi:hypothetical protein